jgi:hypothetical protein
MMHCKLGSLAALALVGGLVAVGCSGDDDDGGGGEAVGGSFCDGAEEVSEMISSAAGTDDVQEIVDRMGELEAPEEIREDWQAIAEVFGAVVGASEESEGQVPGLEVDQARAVEASEAVNAYVQDQCDFSFGGGSGPGAASSNY